MWVEERGLTPHAGVLLLNEPIERYRFMNLPKTDDNDRTHKNDGNTHFDMWSMLLSGQVSHTIQAVQVTCFGILKTLC